VAGIEVKLIEQRQSKIVIVLSTKLRFRKKPRTLNQWKIEIEF